MFSDKMAIVRSVSPDLHFERMQDSVYSVNITKTVFLRNNDFWHQFDPVGNSFIYNDISKEEAQNLTRIYNILHVESFVITFSPISHHPTMNTHIDLFMITVNRLMSQFANELLGIMEHSEIRGYHFHILLFSPDKKRKQFIEGLLAIIGEGISCKFGDEIKNVHPVITHQTIKSVASYINYVKKNPISVFGTDKNVIKMFLNFDRTHVFAKDSIAKRKRTDGFDDKVNSSDELVLFYFQMFKNNIIQYQDILKSSSFQAYLHRPNIKQIYENCKLQFLASVTHEYNLVHMLKSLNRSNNFKPCFCPLLEWLYFHEIDIDIFIYKIGEWLLSKDKKNALLFQGTPDSGKSHIARLLWKMFINPQRIVQDGIFTFANLLNAGCGLWDEPFITPETVDTCKLILEGCPDVQIAIKGQSSVKLNKKVPLVITTNHSISRYVSGDNAALMSRCHVFDTFHEAYPNEFCTASQHYCPNINVTVTDSSYSECSTSTCDTDPVNKRRRTSEPQTQTESCTGRHPVTQDHIIAFVYRCLNLKPQSSFNNYPQVQKYFEDNDYPDICTLSRRNNLWLEVYEELTADVDHSL